MQFAVAVRAVCGRGSCGLWSRFVWFVVAVRAICGSCSLRFVQFAVRAVFLQMKDKPFDIFSASETWLKPDISDSEVALPGYSIIQMDRQNKIGGGTVIYVRDGIPFKTHSDLMNNNLENCMIEVLRVKSKKLFICCIYRAPNNPLENYLSMLSNIILKLPNKSKLILLGDFNSFLSRPY